MRKQKGPRHKPSPLTLGERTVLRSLSMLSAGGTLLHCESVAYMSRLWAKNPAEYGEVVDKAVADLHRLKGRGSRGKKEGGRPS